MDMIFCSGNGNPDVMTMVRADLPQPRAGELLVRVEAAGINRPDVLQRQGKYPVPPDASPVLGLEVAGEVVALGEGAELSGFKTGDTVCALANGGGYAQYCVVPAAQALPWPRGYSALEAAALPETFFTVWSNVYDTGHFKAGESVLIHGGSSGIGTTAIQLVREFGGTPIVTVGSDAKAAACLKLGAALAIDYKTQDFARILQDYTQDKGVDIILDSVGGAYFERNVRSLALDGRLLIIGFMGGAVAESVNLGRLMSRRLTVTSSALRPRSAAQKAHIARQLYDRVWPVLNEGRCKPVIAAVFPLEQAAQAHRLMESSQHIGKIMLEVA